MNTERRVKLRKVLIFVVLFAVFLGVGCTSADTIYVPDDYAKNQWAIDNASAGDTIIVLGGTNEKEEKAYSHLYEIMDKYKNGNDVKMEFITCTSFVDANGKEYDDWIPAIRLE